jgi:GNAT superfamily N-acetyltransferase
MIRIDSRDGRDGTPDGFAAVAHAVYDGDPLWIPEDADELARAFSPRNPWFSAERAARTFVIPERARAAAFFDPSLRIDERPAAFFGYWESTGDPDAERVLFDAVRAWATERGAEDLYGPIQFSTAHSYRIRVSIEPGGVPILGEPHNPARYGTAFEALGLSPVRRYETKVFDGDTRAMAAEAARPFRDRILADGYRLEPLGPETWAAHLRELHALVEEAFRAGFAYAPMRFEEFAVVAGKSLVRRIDPERSTIVYAPDGAVVGFALVYPHWGPLVVRGAGEARVRVSELDWRLHASRLAALGRVDWVLKTMAVAPHAARRGLGHALVARCAEEAIAAGVRVFGALEREDAGSRRLSPAESASRWFVLYGQSLLGSSSTR